MSARIAVIFAVLAALLVLGAACGSDNGGENASDGAGSKAEAASETEAQDDDGAEADSGEEGAATEPIETSSLSKAQFVNRANALCNRNKDKVLRDLESYLEENGGDFESEAALTAGIKESVMPNVEAEIAEIAKLGAPRGERARVEALLTAQQEAVDEVKGMESIPTVFAFEPAFAEATKQLERYGLEACTYGS